MVFLLALVTSFLLAARSSDPEDYRTPIFALDTFCSLMTIWFLCDEIAELKRCQFFITNHVFTTTVEPRYISMFFFIYSSVTGVKKIVRYTEDFVLQRFVISRFHSNIKFKKVAQGAQAILIGTTKRIYVYPFFFFLCGIHFEF